MYANRKCRLQRAIAVILLAISLASRSEATRNWNVASGTANWSVGTNWTPSGTPGSGGAGAEATNIVFTNGVARTVTYDFASPTIGLLSIDLTGAGATVNTLSMPNNQLLQANAIFVGGYNGSAQTNGRGTITQSNGTLQTASGTDFVVAYGAGSTGTYTLSGTGAMSASQSEYVGYSGTGTLTQSAGMNTLLTSAVGSLDIGILSSATGTYNLNGGTLTANTTEYVGDQGTGIFSQTAGTNTIQGSGHNLTLGYAATGVGTYTASGSAALNVSGDVTVGLSGSGTLNVQGNANVNITGALNIGASDHVNLSSGTLRFNGYSRNTTGVFNFTGGTVQLAGNRSINYDTTITDIYNSLNPTLQNAKNLTVEGIAIVGHGTPGGSMTVSNANFISQGQLAVGYSFDNGTLNITNGSTVTNAGVTVGDPNGSSSVYPLGTVNIDASVWNTGAAVIGHGGLATVNVTNGGYVVSSSVYMGLGYTNNNDFNTALVSGPGSTWISNDYFDVGGLGTSKLTIENGGYVYVSGELRVWLYSELDMNGGTLRVNTLNLAGAGQYDYAGKIVYNAGTIQFGGSRNVGTDVDIQRLYGFLPVIPTGKGLTIESTMTLSTALHLDGGNLKTFNLTIASGGSLDFDGGVFELTGGTLTGLSNLAVPTGGEFRAIGTYSSLSVTGAAASIITATGNLTLGNASAVNGFATQGTLSVGANTVTLLDSNDVVFDSTSLATLGNGATPGTLSAANGLTLNFGGNVTGYGTISTPNNIAKPLINNGHIAGTSAAQKITLPGYVKGVGTFDNITFSGTYSPGLSPTIEIAGSLTFSSTNTLIMELGGTTAGSQYDQIQASGALALDGILNVSLINGFSPAAGNSFNLFDWASVSGTFTLQLPALAAGLAWNTSQLYTTGVLSVTAIGISGDYNGDGKVDAADYVFWRKTNINGQSGYNTWRTNFGATSGGAGEVDTSGNAAVPEPTCCALLIIAALQLAASRRRASYRQCDDKEFNP